MDSSAADYLTPTCRSDCSRSGTAFNKTRRRKWARDLPSNLNHAVEDERTVVIHAGWSATPWCWETSSETCRLVPIQF